MEGARQFYKMVSEFNLNVQDLVRRIGNTSTQWSSTEMPVEATYNNTRFVVISFLLYFRKNCSCLCFNVTLDFCMSLHDGII